MAYVTQQLADGTFRIVDGKTSNTVFQINPDSAIVGLDSQTLTASLARTNTTSKNLFMLPANAVPVSLSVSATTGSDATTATISIGKTGTATYFVNAADATLNGDLPLTVAHLGASVGSGSIQVTGVYAQSATTYELASLVLAGAGTGYSADDVLTVVGGTHSVVATIKVDTIVAETGAIATASVLAAGTYTVKPSNPIAVTGGGGADATFTLTWSAPLTNASTTGGPWDCTLQFYV
jgi:hypothetical protein